MKYQSPYFEPKDKAELVAKMADRLSGSDDPELKKAAGGLRAYLKDEGADLDVCLGLKPRQGGRFETPWRLKKDAKRDGLIRDLAQMLPGKVTARSTTLAEWIAAGCTPPGTDASIEAKYSELMTAFPTTPRSSRQIARVLNGETIAARRSR